MKITSKICGIVVLGVMVAFVIGCGATAPTETPVPPTALPTSVPPTAVPPTRASATQAAPSGSTQAGPLTNAIDKVKNATSYRVNLTITGSGSFAAQTGAPDQTPVASVTPTTSDKPITLVSMQGEVNGKDAHYVLQGELIAFLGIDATKSFEVISSDGDAYVKGPVPLLGATEDKWYKAPPNAAQIAQPPLTPGSFLESFGETGISPADFKSAGNESLDGQSCEVFAGDKTAVINAFSKLGGATGATQEDLDSIDNAVFEFWVCNDGYLHQVQMVIEGHDKNKPDQKGSFQILMKIMDFGSSVTIVPPADSLPLQIPQQPAPEASPTP